MTVDFRNIKRTRTTKRKLMLWIDDELCEEIERQKPSEITLQEAIRQIISFHINSAIELKDL